MKKIMIFKFAAAELQAAAAAASLQAAGLTPAQPFLFFLQPAVAAAEQPTPTHFL
jgi:hypothetical protein